MIYALLRALVRLAAALILGPELRLTGLDNIPRRGAVLVVGNHVGAIDPVLLGINIPRLDVHYMAKSELFEPRFLGWLFRHCHTFPVVRDSPDRAALRRALDLLAAGHVLLLYPEGTRSSDGSIGRAHAGAGFIARHSGATIVPVGAWGSDRVIPRGVHFPRRAPVRVVVGAAFSLPAGQGKRALSNQHAVDYMMARVAETAERARRSMPPAPQRLSRRPPAA